MIEESKHYLLIVNHFPWGLRHHFVDQGQYNQSYGFSNNHIWMWELDHKEEWMLKNLCFQTVVLEKTLESPLDSKEIKPVTPKGNQPWIFIGRTHTEAEALILWPPDVKSWLVRKDPGAGEDWGPRGEGGVRGWDGWMASLTQRTWVWVSSGREWRTGKPGVLQSLGLQRVRHDWVTEHQQQPGTQAPIRWLDASQPCREPDPALDLLPGAPAGELSPGWPASLKPASR